MEPITVLFNEIAELCLARGIENIKDMPGACYLRVDDQWELAVNGHKEDVKCEPSGTMGATIPPFHAAVWFNGWLAGFVAPFGGCLAAGEAANEDTLTAAIQKSKQTTLGSVKQRSAV